MRRRALFAIGLLCAVSLPASETTTFSYDAKGRLVGVSRAGTINNGVTANYCYDKADNRSQVAVSSGACVAAGSGSSFGIGDGSTSEGGTATFTVTRYGDTASAQAVSYASAGGTAVSGTDFTAAGGTLSFAAGETVKSVSVATIQDFLYEGNEGFVVNLSGATGGAIISDGQGAGTVVDDEPPIPPGFSVSDPSAAEGAGLVFTVTRSGTAVSSLSINYATANGTAASGSEYTAASGTLTFAQSETSKTVTVATIDDAYVEPTKTMLMNLSGATGGAGIVDGQGTGTIDDNDAGTSFAIGDVSVGEGGTLVLTVTRTAGGSGSYTVNYASADGTALAASDYTAAGGTLTFALSDTSKTISIATTDDSAVEASETVLVNLSSPGGGATISDGQGVGTITDNDAPANPTLSVSDGSNTEGFPITFTVTRGGDTSVSVSVSYATANGTAGNSDFTAASGTLTFAANQTTKTVTVQTTNNNVQENVETFTLNLSNPTGGATISDGQGVGTIFDDDGEPCPNCRG